MIEFIKVKLSGGFAEPNPLSRVGRSLIRIRIQTRVRDSTRAAMATSSALPYQQTKRQSETQQPTRWSSENGVLKIQTNLACSRVRVDSETTPDPTQVRRSWRSRDRVSRYPRAALGTCGMVHPPPPRCMHTRRVSVQMGGTKSSRNRGIDDKPTIQNGQGTSRDDSLVVHRMPAATSNVDERGVTPSTLFRWCEWAFE